MSRPPQGPGKLSPKLFLDILTFDPLKSAVGNRNLLTGHAPIANEEPQLAPAIGSCRHDYTVKTAQSVVPPLDLRPNGATHYKVAMVCKKCRIHADVKIDYSKSANPCPTTEYPLHHFQHLDRDVVGYNRIQYFWQCSAPECQAELEVSFRLARLSDKEKDLLTNTENLRRRYEIIVAQDPEREGVRQAIPIEPLSRLRKYTKDALNPAHTKRTFPANNKRFMEAFGWFGQDCYELLTRLGFHYENMEWTLPNPPPIIDRMQADGSSPRELLEDLEIELAAWMSRISSETGALNPAAAEGWPSADRDLERTLGAMGYLRHVSTRRADVPNEMLPYFNSLGAPSDCADQLLEFAYDRQSLCDPPRQPYYFECLQSLAQHRGTERLQMKVAMLQSQGLISRRDLTAAYRALNIPLAEASDYSDDRIINLYQVRQQDLSPAGAEELRQALYKIGVDRHSNRLINASRQSVDTYKDALTWLGNGADESTPDDSIIAIYGAKIAENKANEEIGKKAITTIARARKSNSLNSWLLSGTTDSYSMSIEDAQQILNITVPIEDIDQTLLLNVFSSAREDRPGETTEKAISTIQERLAGMNTAMTATPASMPVGLISHGNTCYLNSLLQYYFSIEPLRKVVLQYERYKLPIDANTTKDAKVGRLTIGKTVIEGGQRFSEELQHMFERMIHERGTAVKPHSELVCRAFLDPKDYALMTPVVKDIGINGNGNGVGQKREKFSVDVDMEGQSTNGDGIDAAQDSMASSSTLQGDDLDVKMADGEKPLTPLASPDQKPQDVKKKDSLVRPPSLAPRRKSLTNEERLRMAEEKARQQQDVAEVHDAIMFRLRSGMKPEGVDENGEQIDPLISLFAYRGVETPVDHNGRLMKGTKFYDTCIQLNVPEEDTDIYSALDESFDLQPRDNLQTFKALRTVPPLLQISMPRIGYNRDKGGAFKSEVVMRLEDELYMDRYMDSPEVLPIRERCWDWRKLLRKWREEEKEISAGVERLDGPSAMAKAADYLHSIARIDEVLDDVDIDGLGIGEIMNKHDDLASVLAHEAEKLKARQARLKPDIDALQQRLDAEFSQDEFKKLKYRLAVVFMHRGSTGGGHYWVFIRDFTHNVWRSYNDETVTEVPAVDLEKKLYASVSGSPNWGGTPTYAVYVRDDMKEEIVQPLCRELEESPELEVQELDWMVEGKTAQQYRAVDPKTIQEGGDVEW
ncbi:hypothetical protein M433DRAFT_4966 [Acidomyces richmondensis BFW]|nr:MAG: hypothetical protein FE78DRAFT_32591 [Acidomyces sp. 'richmondensis']KYG45007.1 hypothetical protein M433DRAFT_4966 [Acidomyces richmondensis BFW]